MNGWLIALIVFLSFIFLVYLSNFYLDSLSKNTINVIKIEKPQMSYGESGLNQAIAYKPGMLESPPSVDNAFLGGLKKMRNFF